MLSGGTGGDITGFKATVVPVGEDQAPLIEQTNEIVRRINATAGRPVLPEARAINPQGGPVAWGRRQAKMSKSAGNAIPLSASPDDIRNAVRAMFTDPNHLRVEDPGRIEGNVVFSYLDAFDPDQDGLANLRRTISAVDLEMARSRSVWKASFRSS